MVISDGSERLKEDSRIAWNEHELDREARISQNLIFLLNLSSIEERVADFQSGAVENSKGRGDGLDGERGAVFFADKSVYASVFQDGSVLSNLSTEG